MEWVEIVCQQPEEVLVVYEGCVARRRLPVGKNGDSVVAGVHVKHAHVNLAAKRVYCVIEDDKDDGQPSRVTDSLELPAGAQVVATKPCHMVKLRASELTSLGFFKDWLLHVGQDLDEAVVVLDAAMPPEHLSKFREMHRPYDELTTTLESASAMVPAVEKDAPWDAPQRWWARLTRTDLTNLIRSVHEQVPVNVYHMPTLQRRARDVKAALTHVSRIFFATKSNSHPRLLRALHRLGFGLECVSLQEVEHALACTRAAPSDILFTPNFAARREYEAALKLGVHVTVDNVYCLREWPDVFSEASIALRIDPVKGRGHHKHVVTAGAQSKFGMALEDMDDVQALCQQHNITVAGLHCHSGSGIFDATAWHEHATCLLAVAKQFPSVKFIDIGGGLGVPYRFSDKRLNLESVNEQLATLKRDGIELWMEPGRFLVSECGCLLARVAQIKRKAGVKFVGTTAGMNNLLRPALYSSHHEVANLSHLCRSEGDMDARTACDREPTTICGPICESADIFGRDRMLPVDTREGDVILVDTTGAYGATMESSYNLRPPAACHFLLGPS